MNENKDIVPSDGMAFLSQYKIPIIIGSASVVTLAVVYKTSKKGKKRK